MPERSAKRRAGWLMPLIVFFATACVSAFLLANYFAPPAPAGQEEPAPTDATRPIEVSLGKNRFRIPANYILLASARRGGPLTRVAMIAILPDLQGYTLGAAPDFAGNAPDSRVVTLLLKTGEPVLSEEERLKRIYVAQVEDPTGKPGPYGLKQYDFKGDSGYRGQDLFVGAGEEGTLVILCTKLSPEIAAPSCMRDLPLGDGLSLSYRFRRAHLAEWRRIDGGVRALIARFRDKN